MNRSWGRRKHIDQYTFYATPTEIAGIRGAGITQRFLTMKERRVSLPAVVSLRKRVDAGTASDSCTVPVRKLPGTDFHTEILQAAAPAK
jgi:hypothetical protein